MNIYNGSELLEKIRTLGDTAFEGLTLKHIAIERWAMCLTDSSVGRSYKYQVFDAYGFYYHVKKMSKHSLIEEAFNDGFKIVSAPVLDSFIDKEEWKQGSTVQNLVNNKNRKPISFVNLLSAKQRKERTLCTQ